MKPEKGLSQGAWIRQVNIDIFNKDCIHKILKHNTTKEITFNKTVIDGFDNYYGLLIDSKVGDLLVRFEVKSIFKELEYAGVMPISLLSSDVLDSFVGVMLQNDFVINDCHETYFPENLREKYC